jgi:hypothetical protein
VYVCAPVLPCVACVAPQPLLGTQATYALLAVLEELSAPLARQRYEMRARVTLRRSQCLFLRCGARGSGRHLAGLAPTQEQAIRTALARNLARAAAAAV